MFQGCGDAFCVSDFDPDCDSDPDNDSDYHPGYHPDYYHHAGLQGRLNGTYMFKGHRDVQRVLKLLFQIMSKGSMSRFEFTG
jgi:hypothetical protein